MQTRGSQTKATAGAWLWGPTEDSDRLAPESGRAYHSGPGTELEPRRGTPVARAPPGVTSAF